MNRKIVAVALGLTIIVGNLFGIFAINRGENGVTNLFGEHDPDANTVGLWHFNEGSGQYANDSSSNKNDGVLSPNYPSDAPQWVNGKFRKALQFRGFIDYVEVPHSGSLDITDEITMEAWVKPYSFSTIPYILCKEKTATSVLYALLITSDGKPKAFFDTPNPITALDPIPLNEWTYIAATFNGSVRSIYINGIENVNETYSHVCPTSTFPLTIGCAGAGDYFDGIIDEVRLSNVGRTAEEIFAHYNSTRQILYVDDSYTGTEPGFGTTKFKVIQNAIDNASSGDTVFVFNGTYYEEVEINITLSLMGENRDSTIICGAGPRDTIRINANWTNVTGFTLTNGYAGVFINHSSNNDISGNNITANNKGIYIDHSSNIDIMGNNIFSNTNSGIWVEASPFNNISGNNISSNGWDGIRLQCQSNNLTHNNFWNDGLRMSGSSLSDYNAHVIPSNNYVNGKPLYYYKNINGFTVDGEVVGQLFLVNCTNVEVRNLMIDNTDLGIEVAYSDHIIVSGCHLSNNAEGLYMMRSDICNITDNVISWNERNGLYLMLSHDNHVSGNELSSNNWKCLMLYSSNGNEIFRNNVTDNYGGIEIIGSQKNYVTENNICDNNCGVKVFASSSRNNTLYHNNFLFNTIQAIDEENNIWNDTYPSGGNFWSDFSGIDMFSGPNQDQPGSDAIGDTNYTIDSDSVDNYPLTSPTGGYIFLYPGWNLISIPKIQSTTNLGVIFGSIEGSYDCVEQYNATDTSDHWKVNSTSKPNSYNDFEHLDHHMGLWVHITEPSGILFGPSGASPAQNQTLPLYPGWNLVGYPSLNNKNRTEALNNLTFGGEVDSIWTFDARIQQWIELDEPEDHFEIGRGYWIHAKTKCEWEVPL